MKLSPNSKLAYNAELGKMEDATLPHWEKYYADKKAFEEMMEARKPVPPDPKLPQSEFTYLMDTYKKDLCSWQMSLHCDAPNRPGYIRANDD